MNCETCINKTHFFKGGHCRTMIEPPKELFCYMTKKQAIHTEYTLLRKAEGNAKYDVRKHIKWLNGLEG